jgi:hypothetical protein
MGRDTETAEHDLLKRAYRNFNARNIDQLLTSLHPNVEWANGWEGGHAHGREAVRAYWARQFEVLDPHVEPINIQTGENGQQVVKVHQVVHNKDGGIACRYRGLPRLSPCRRHDCEDGHFAG